MAGIAAVETGREGLRQVRRREGGAVGTPTLLGVVNAHLEPGPRRLREVAGVIAVVRVPDPGGVAAGLFFDEL
jgi:hypothetical protein